MKYSLMAVAAAFVVGTGAHASSISVTTFSDTAFSDMVKGNTVVEDFEDGSTLLPIPFEGGAGILSDGVGSRQYGEVEAGGSITSTKVGSFTGLGGTGSGTTCQALSLLGNDCKNIALQFDPPLNDQGNIVPEDGDWSINAADTLGIKWVAELAGGQKFSSLFFAIRDAADQGPDMTVTVGDTSVSFKDVLSGLLGGNNRLPDGNEQIVFIDFGESVTQATIEMRTGENDSFTIDGASINVVPLPAPALLLLGGLGLMAGLRRRKAV